MARLITKDTGLQSKYVVRNIKIERLGEKYFPRVVVTIDASRIPLIAFSARGPEPSRGKGRGVSYRLITGRGRNPKAFIASVPNAGPESNWHKGVFVRASNLTMGARPMSGKSAGAWSLNLPMVQLHGPSVAHVFVKYLPDFYKVAGDALLKNLQHEIDWRRSKQAQAALPAQEWPIQPMEA
jgi:hypothetical protein